MSVRHSQARRAAFLAALAETGNQTLAAERAKVSRSWVTVHRRDEPAFRAAMDAAVTQAAERLATATRVRPNGRWREQSGEELSVQHGNRRLIQVVRTRLKQWTPRVEARFLAALRNSCNVNRACAHVGLTKGSAYRHRDRWPDFQKRWDQAIEDGYDALSMATVAAAGAMLGDTDMVPEPEMGVPTVGQAIQALQLHQRRMRGEPYRRGWRRRPRTLDEVRDSILRKLEMMARADIPDDPPAGAAGGGAGAGGGADRQPIRPAPVQPDSNRRPAIRTLEDRWER